MTTRPGGLRAALGAQRGRRGSAGRADRRARVGLAAGGLLDLGIELAGGAGVAGVPRAVGVGGVGGEALVVAATTGTDLLDDDDLAVLDAGRAGAGEGARQVGPLRLDRDGAPGGGEGRLAGRGRGHGEQRRPGQEGDGDLLHRVT